MTFHHILLNQLIISTQSNEEIVNIISIYLNHKDFALIYLLYFIYHK